jgi:hypothetical protein
MFDHSTLPWNVQNGPPSNVRRISGMIDVDHLCTCLEQYIKRSKHLCKFGVNITLKIMVTLTQLLTNSFVSLRGGSTNLALWTKIEGVNWLIIIETSIIKIYKNFLTFSIPTISGFFLWYFYMRRLFIHLIYLSVGRRRYKLN